MATAFIGAKVASRSYLVKEIRREGGMARLPSVKPDDRVIPPAFSEDHFRRSFQKIISEDHA
jgi:hypothetical protein